jgi:hypothetical protein
MKDKFTLPQINALTGNATDKDILQNIFKSLLGELARMRMEIEKLKGLR